MVGGAILTSDPEAYQQLKFLQRHWRGAGPLDCWLVLRFETLTAMAPLRQRPAHCCLRRTCGGVIHPACHRPSHAQRSPDVILGDDFTYPEGSETAARRWLPAPGSSPGRGRWGVESLIEHLQHDSRLGSRLNLAMTHGFMPPWG
jgi:hypothetical protein